MCAGPHGVRAGGAPIDFDHVGIAVADVAAPLRTAVTRLGATAIYGGLAPGCRYVVTRVGDEARGMHVELLEPEDVEREPFLERFLAKRGAGPHHITFTTDDVDRLLARLRERGLVPTVARLGNPLWREAFFDPRAVGGIVVQLGETNGGPSPAEGFARARADEPLGPASVERRGWAPDEQGWWAWPGERDPATAYLLRIVLASADLDASVALYGELLGGEAVERTDAAVELRWPSGGRLRFELRSDRPPGVDRLELAHAPADLRELAGARLEAVASPLVT